MSTNDCQTVQRHLSAYHDGELSAAQNEAFVKHFESCASSASCAAELAAFVVGHALRLLAYNRKPERGPEHGN